MHFYLATLRCLMSDEVFKAYFEKHAPVTTSGRRKGSISTIIAMMRKLVRGLWHCASYDVAFNSEQLFDTRRLNLNASSSLDDVEEIEDAYSTEKVAKITAVAKDVRDRSFTYLDGFWDDFREAGRYLFRTDAHRLAFFRDAYQNQTRQNRRTILR